MNRTQRLELLRAEGIPDAEAQKIVDREQILELVRVAYQWPDSTKATQHLARAIRLLVR